MFSFIYLFSKLLLSICVSSPVPAQCHLVSKTDAVACLMAKTWLSVICSLGVMTLNLQGYWRD